MPQLTPIELEDGTVIYIQASENVSIPSPEAVTPSNQEEKSTDKLDFLTKAPQETADRDFNPQKQVAKSFQGIEKTVRAYTISLINSFKNLAAAEISEVTLEFGVNMGAMTGIPYIATGNTDCNVKIKVKCIFPKEEK
ncbi:MAG: hypothetical protein F6J96_19785 [Symploca sp. SIO1C2]|nr:hypothetical protein [Symploca sp. SIO1C2]